MGFLRESNEIRRMQRQASASRIKSIGVAVVIAAVSVFGGFWGNKYMGYDSVAKGNVRIEQSANVIKEDVKDLSAKFRHSEVVDEAVKKLSSDLEKDFKELQEQNAAIKSARRKIIKFMKIGETEQARRLIKATLDMITKRQGELRAFKAEMDKLGTEEGKAMSTLIQNIIQTNSMVEGMMQEMGANIGVKF